MVANFIPAERQKYIHNILHQNGIVKVTKLSEILGVSELTIRRDLDELERKGILERTHGGAIYNQRMCAETLYEQRYKIHRNEKEAIGRAVVELIEDGDTLLINSGSTTREVIHHLKKRKTRIITNNLGAIHEAMDSEIELILIGGLYRTYSNSSVGSLALLSLKQVYGSKAIIGVDGLSIKYGLTHPILDEAEIARDMIEQTPGPIIVVADHSKLGVVSNFISVPLEKINIIVTDDGIDDEYRNNLKKIGIEVVVASKDDIINSDYEKSGR